MEKGGILTEKEGKFAGALRALGKKMISNRGGGMIILEKIYPSGRYTYVLW